jgi:hypothetical protein
MKDKIIFSLCDLRGLCGEKITTEHTEDTERVKFMNKRIIFGHWVHVSMFNER